MADLLGGKKEEVYGFNTLYREIGYYLSRLEHYTKCIHFFDEAIKKTPGDVRALMGSCRALSMVCKYEDALEDVRTALGLDPDDLRILAHKALNTYLNCEFEEGLIQNVRLVPRRQKPDCFLMGIMHCRDAIENCLGERTGRPLRDHYKIIRRLAWQKNFEAQKKLEPKAKNRKKKKVKKEEVQKRGPKIAERKKAGLGGKSVVTMFDTKSIKSRMDALTLLNELNDVHSASGGYVDRDDLELRDKTYSETSELEILPPPIRFRHRPLQRYTTNIDNYMAEKYLHSLYKDKIYLNDLVKRLSSDCPNQKSTDQVNRLARESFKAVSYKQELLRTRRPFYYIKFQEATSSGALKTRQDQALEKAQQFAKRDIGHIVAKMKEALEGKKFRQLLELGEKLKLFCDSKSKKVLPDRDDYLTFLYESVCRANFDLMRINKNQHPWDQEKRIYKMLGLHFSREPSVDSVIAEFKNVFVDWKKQAGVYSERIEKASSPEEMAWLYHELARFHLEMKQPDVARVYARKCIAEARESEEMRWVANASMIMIKVNIMQHNKNESKSEALEALEVAKEMQDPKLEKFFEMCASVIEKVEFDDIHGPKVLQKREKQIVDMMAEDRMKGEAAHLFRMISAMPAARRMTVMPGIKLQDDEGSTAAARRATIIQGGKKQDDSPLAVAKMKAKHRRSSPADDERGTGVGFMDMIQYHLD